MNSVTCLFCSRQLTNKYRVDAHLRRHIGERPYGCDICGNSFTESSNLSAHVRLHSNTKPFKCDQCPNKAFAQRQYLMIHKKSVHKGIKQHECKICKKQFYLRNDMTCELCAKRFATNKDLYRHIRTHTLERPYKCLVFCQSSFRNKQDVANHMRTHTGEKPFICKYCGREYSQMTGMIIHQSNIHSVNVKAWHKKRY